MGKSKKVRGTVGYSDLEGGYLTLTAGPVQWKLEGAPAACKPGLTVEVEGHEDGGMMGIGFGAPVLRVTSFKVV